MNKFETYAKELIEKHGVIEANRIANKMLTKVKRGEGIVFYDEADWTLNTKTLTYVLTKNQRPEKIQKRKKRIKDTINFYTQVIIEIKKQRI